MILLSPAERQALAELLIDRIGGRRIRHVHVTATTSHPKRVANDVESTADLLFVIREWELRT